MSSSKLILPIIGVFILISSCNKYPDGPKFTLLGKKDRMEGLWDLQETSHSDGTTTYDGLLEIMELTDDNEYFYKTGSITIEGTWRFESKKEKDKVAFTVANYTVTYKIMRLKDQELWLKNEINGDVMKYKNNDD